MVSRSVVTLMLLGVTMPLVAAEKTGFQTKEFTNADGKKSPYVVFIPAGYDGTKPMPVILFLHGAGETKGGAKMPVEVGLGAYIRKHEKTFGFITIIPQAESVKTQVVGRWQDGSPDAERALKMLETVQKEYKTDPKKVYLTGLSMGGFGTWSLAAAHPTKWAAIAPVCGGGNPANAEKFKDLPCWCFHGGADAVVKPQLSRTMIKALEAAGGKPKYTEYPGVGHNSWDQAYATEDLYTWFLSHSAK